MRRLSSVAGALAVAFLCGCEWTGTSEDEAWNDSYSWIDFSGTYRAPDGGPVVNGTVVNPGNEGGQEVVSGEKVGETPASNPGFRYSGYVANLPIVADSFSLRVGSQFSFFDNAAGVLTQVEPGGGTGRIDYQTGFWVIDIVGGTPDASQPITASYVYTIKGTSGSTSSGSSGNPIVSLTVNQTGNRLTITDSRGLSYSGQVTGASVPENAQPAGSIRLVFEAEGNGVRMSGSFSGDWSGTAAGASGTLGNRVMQGSWIESGSEGDLYAVSGSVSLTPPAITPATPSTTTTPTTTTPTTTP